MKYISTRGKADSLNFEEVVLAGLASDRGLYVPENIPTFSSPDIAAMAGLSYPELAFKIMQPFIEGEVEDGALKQIINEAYATFRHDGIAPLKQLGSHEWVLELFHGPTLAFKDFALQFLGRLLGHILQKRGEKVIVLGATSGDTGSAAIAGFRGRENMDIFILHPHGRVSNVQRRQMTTVEDANVHNIAIDGNFDDCQDLVKTLFADTEYRKERHLVAVNSINWARILAQVVYYFYAALHLGAPGKAMSFSVPTGNFGDIFAGYIARRMGLPIDQLIIATNRNDILARCVEKGEYAMEWVEPTISPSMDIQISSNFERLLFDLYDRNSQQIDGLMREFRSSKKIVLDAQPLTALKTQFASAKVDDVTTKQVIKEVYGQTGELLDPHTAVGVKAGRDCWNRQSPLITLATAHPAKFPDAVKAASGVHPALPPHMQDLFEKTERFDTLSNDIDALKAYIGQQA